MTVRWSWLASGALLLLLALPLSISASYNVHWLENGSSVVKRQNQSPLLDVYCYKGRSKSIIYIWQTVLLLLEIQTDSYNLYEAGSPEEVWSAYKADNTLWSLEFLSSKKPRELKLDPFNSTCVIVSTSQSYTVHFKVTNFDHLKITLCTIGVLLFLYSTSLSGNKVFFYGVGILMGICASFMILVYFISKMLPGKPVIYGSMIGGWAVGLYFFRFLWSNFQPLLITYKEYVVWYAIIMGFISFIICYKIGSPKDKRNKNIISWTLQGIGLAAIYYSTNIEEVVIAMAVLLVIIKYIPQRWIMRFRSYWLKKFPPKRVLLTEEQYYEEGTRETAKALEELRGYCSSPECNQWRLMLQLKNNEKFAKFMSGNNHISDQEMDDYESSDFRIRRPSNNLKQKSPLTVTSTLNEDDFTSDDSSISPDEL